MIDEIVQEIEISQSSKYNKDMSDANDKMKNISEIKEPKKVVVKGNVYRKRTNSDYDRLWDLFTRTQLEDFEKYLGYGEKEIRKAGIKKFINANDWYYNEDVTKWKTDLAHVIPCVHCAGDFATYEIDLGLCPKCKKKYDIERFSNTCMANEASDPGITSALKLQFALDTEFRKNYLIKTIREQVEEAIDFEFHGVNSYLMFKNAIEEGRYDYLYKMAVKHKDKMTDKAQNRFYSINAEIEGVKSKDEAAGKLKEIYFKQQEA